MRGLRSLRGPKGVRNVWWWHEGLDALGQGVKMSWTIEDPNIGVSMNGYTPKWMVIMESPIEMDENWGYPYFRKPPYHSCNFTCLSAIGANFSHWFMCPRMSVYLIVQFLCVKSPVCSVHLPTWSGLPNSIGFHNMLSHSWWDPYRCV